VRNASLVLVLDLTPEVLVLVLSWSWEKGIVYISCRREGGITTPYSGRSAAKACELDGIHINYGNLL